MPDTISTEKYVSTACAVFKIDLKGRFVYIDEETEELFGLAREELFGKSLYDFITTESRHLLDSVLGRRSRYELFYESVPLGIRTDEGSRQLDAVVTVNFISGNPVNYQFILKLAESREIASPTAWEHMFLSLLHDVDGDIDFNCLAEIFCAAAGYSAGECYIPDHRDSLTMVGSYPSGNPGHTAPAYLEQLRALGRDRFSFNPEDTVRHGGFGDGRSEAVLCLQYEGGGNLIIRLIGPQDYHPSAPQMDNIRLITGFWNRQVEHDGRTVAAGERLGMVGMTGDALGFGMAVVNDEFEMVCANERFLRLTGQSHETDPQRDFRKIIADWKGLDGQTSGVVPEKAPFSAMADGSQLRVDLVILPGLSEAVTALAAPFDVDGTPFYLYCLIARDDIACHALPAAGTDAFELLSLTHDMRAPLITIEAFTRRLQTKYAGRLDSDGTFITDSIIENSRILQQMIDGLNQLSRNRTDREAAQDIYLKELLKEMTQELRAAYPGTQYRVRFSGGLPLLRAPRRKLIALFRNILDNAFKYSALVAEPMIEIDYTLLAGRHRFLISDNGPGIEPDYVEKVFSPFFRTPEASTIQGSGIGLALAHDIVTSWGGTIQVESRERPGTTIALTLPPEIPG